MFARAISLASVCLTVSACGTDNETMRMGQLVLQAMQGREAQMVTRERAADIPYASAGLQLGDGDQGLLVLGTAIPPNLEWYGGEEIMVRTRDGRIVRTAGLPYDLGGLEIEPAPAAAGATSYRLRYDFPDLGVFGAIGECTVQQTRAATIQILGASLSTQHTTERCSVPSLNWRFQQEFWRDAASRTVWRTRQHLHPRLPAVTLETFRPAAAG